MKIFNWMHRKLQNAGGSSGASGGRCFHVPQIRKAEVFKGEEAMMAGFEAGCAAVKGKEEILLHDTLTDGAAMLAIGTLGSHCCGFLPRPAGHLVEPKTTGDQPFLTETPAEEITTGKGKEVETPAAKEIEEVALADDEIVQELPPPLPLPKEEKERKEGKRTTLAHLFAAEPFTALPAALRDDSGRPSESPSGVEKTATSKPHPEASSHDNSNNKKQQQQQQQKKKKKNKTKKADELNNDGKLQKLITKMLKKKIHPVLSKSAEREAVQATKMETSHAIIYW